ncbi:alkylation response protein AidB-like acyl-CoA dehydrogenase [Symbiobacterium terraclitae]|uniref:Medium-chain specific acyl-CoA dehydrogenase, mitochondrial n=1 Tax=Symbiobacterium terraclitae TaxID=557451 RepID=A0ABS4JTD9_9FIRM|nr:alkylation response protein AidB-like acyl-CoA dehydrogenase [Symbiobacterium terraclitae]
MWKRLFLSEEHEEIRRLVRQFAERELQPHAEEWEAQEFMPSDVLRRMGELGLLGLRYPAEYGGQGLDIFASIVVYEELARCRAAGPAAVAAVHAEIALPLILKFGTEAQRRRYLVPGLRGEKIACLAITEPDTGSDVAAIRTRAVRDGDGWVLDGAKTFISNGARADFAVVLARTSPEGGHRGLSHFIVEKGTPGFRVARQLKKAGQHSADTAELQFDQVRLPADALLGEENRGFYQTMWQFQTERLIAAAVDVGRARVALELAVAYAGTRQAFGGLLAEKQVIRHRIADMATRVETARRLLYTTAWEVKSGGQPAAAISMCKLVAANTALSVADDALQIHGGYGYMQEYPVQRLWRDARVSRIVAGTDEIMREIIGREVIGKGGRE